MGAPRKFDHDEARALHAAGVPVKEIAARVGVTVTAIYRLVTSGWLEREREYGRRYQKSALCADCGGPCTRAGHPSQGAHGVTLCLTCAKKRDRTRFVEIDGEMHAKCFTCSEMKALDEFAAGNRYRDVRPNGVHASCRDCNTAMKRAWRNANREKQRAYDRERKRRQKAAA
jgi:hypothetical protein